MGAKGLHLSHHCSLCGGNLGDSLSELIIAMLYQITAQLFSSRGHFECTKFGGYMHRRDVEVGLWIH